jgi:hypothetical protein
VAVLAQPRLLIDDGAGEAPERLAVCRSPRADSALDRHGVDGGGLAPREALRTLEQKGWLTVAARERLVYMSARSEPDVWRAVQGAGIASLVYCPDKLPDDPNTLAALRPWLSSSSYPFPRR